MKTLVFCLTFLMLPSFAMAEDASRAVSTDDICAVRPDLCGGGPRKRRKKVRKKPMDFADFNESVPAANNRPAAAGESARIRPAGHAPAQRSRISFSAYMNANHSSSAISGRGSGRQDAFQVPNRPAYFNEGPGESMREGTAPAQPSAPAAQPTHSN